MKSDLTDIEVMIHHVTEKALFVSADGNRNAAVWLPKSRVETESEPVIGKAQTISLQQSLAEEKGLV